MPEFDPTAPLSFAHPDPDRPAKEAALRAVSEDAFRALYAITRVAATRMKVAGDMEALYGLTRGMKTLQRIGGERGIILKATRIGFLKGAGIEVPGDFDQMGQAETLKTFEDGN